MTGDDSARAAAEWPLFGIHLVVGDVSLRPVCEGDLEILASILPDDAEHDPASLLLDGLTLDENRRRLFLQSYWRSWGTWSVDAWCIFFAVAYRDRLVGIQTLEGDHFPTLRVVDSSSWLARGDRGKGIARAMRTAVLSLAFDHMGAAAAVTSAREDNGPSLGVSRGIGYEDNGVSTSLSPSGPCTLRHMILHRGAWLSSGNGSAVTVTGIRACAPWFGTNL